MPKYYLGRAALLVLCLGQIAVAQTTPQVDIYGDPLPPGAVARFGTVRYRVEAQLHGSRNRGFVWVLESVEVNASRSGRVCGGYR